MNLASSKIFRTFRAKKSVKCFKKINLEIGIRKKIFNFTYKEDVSWPHAQRFYHSVMYPTIPLQSVAEEKIWRKRTYSLNKRLSTIAFVKAA